MHAEVFSLVLPLPISSSIANIARVSRPLHPAAILDTLRRPSACARSAGCRIFDQQRHSILPSGISGLKAPTSSAIPMSCSKIRSGAQPSPATCPEFVSRSSEHHGWSGPRSRAGAQAL